MKGTIGLEKGAEQVVIKTDQYRYLKAPGSVNGTNTRTWFTVVEVLSDTMEIVRDNTTDIHWLAERKESLDHPFLPVIVLYKRKGERPKAENNQGDLLEPAPAEQTAMF